MELDGKYFFLNRENIFIKGRNKGAIYNLYTGDVFSIDKDFSELLNLCEKERILPKFLNCNYS